jgi:CubicO group peptidase (beta-lactamase class C family)
MKQKFQVVDQIFRQFQLQHPSPGLVYAVAQAGKILHWRAFGQRDLGSKASVQRGTKFRIASITKGFCASAIFKLQERGALSLSQSVAQLLPNLRVDSFWKTRTLRELLSMDLDLVRYDDPLVDRSLGFSDSEYAALFSKKPLIDAGSRRLGHYSNLAYILLGQVIQECAGVSLMQFISKELLRPLAMRDTVWNVDAADATFSQGYNRDEASWRPEPTLTCRGFGVTFAGLWSTIDDLARWSNFFISPHRVGDKSQKILSAESRLSLQHGRVPFRSSMQRLYALDAAQLMSGAYGYGLVEQYLAGQSYCSHSGGLPGFGAHVRWHQESGLALIALANATYCPVWKACIQALEYLVRDEKKLRKPSTALSAAARELRLLTQSWEQKRAERLFAANVALDWDFNKLKVQLSTIGKLSRTAASSRVQADEGNVGLLEFFRSERKNAASLVARIEFLLGPDAAARVQGLSLAILERSNAELRQAEKVLLALLRGEDRAAATKILISAADRALLASIPNAIGGFRSAQTIERQTKAGKFAVEVLGAFGKARVFCTLSSKRDQGAGKRSSLLRVRQLE